MRQREVEESGICAVCGEELDREFSFHFCLSTMTAVCQECARRYGDVYDAEQERWRVSPKFPSSINTYLYD